MNIITPLELKTKIDKNEPFQLIDVREEHEFEDYNIGGINIPLDQVFNSLDQINQDKPVIFVCNTGRKTAAILHTIKRKLNLNNESLFTLEGGVPNYRLEIGD